jgi:hypothetical protein
MTDAYTLDGEQKRRCSMKQNGVFVLVAALLAEFGAEVMKSDAIKKMKLEGMTHARTMGNTDGSHRFIHAGLRNAQE